MVVLSHIRCHARNLAVIFFMFLVCDGGIARDRDVEPSERLKFDTGNTYQIPYGTPELEKAIFRSSTSTKSDFYLRCMNEIKAGRPDEASKLIGLYENRLWNDQWSFVKHFEALYLGDAYRAKRKFEKALRAYESAVEASWCGTCLAMKAQRRRARIDQLLKEHPSLKRHEIDWREVRSKQVRIAVESLERFGLGLDQIAVVDGMSFSVVCGEYIWFRPRLSVRATIKDDQPLRKYGGGFRKHERVVLRFRPPMHIEFRTLLRTRGNVALVVSAKEIQPSLSKPKERRPPVKGRPIHSLLDKGADEDMLELFDP